MASGIRNWRGEIVERVAPSGNAQDEYAGATSSSAMEIERQPGLDSPDAKLKKRERKKKKKKRNKDDGPVFVKDEFGRDIEVTASKSDKKKKKRDRRSSSASPHPKAMINGTPPPADPFRPQLDENRYGSRRPSERNPRYSRSRSRSRGRHREWGHRRSRSRSGSRSRHRSLRRSRSRDRSRSRSRGRSRSRSRDGRDFDRDRRRRPSASRERKWTHDAYDTRSPSPPRQSDPLYKPEPEKWVSRAGGVYIPRK